MGLFAALALTPTLVPLLMLTLMTQHGFVRTI
jgi:hypothetical protein